MATSTTVVAYKTKKKYVIHAEIGRKENGYGAQVEAKQLPN